jgi:addiction module RelE/StbE family toxin
MNIEYTSDFIKNFKKRILPYKEIHKKTLKRIVLFSENINNPILHNHKLQGKKSAYFAFSITGNIRVIYKIHDNNTIVFTDIGSHNQVYK